LDKDIPQVSFSRRRFLQGLGSAGAAAALFRMAPAPAAAPALAMTDLKDGLGVISGAGGNVVVLAKPEGLLLVDSGSAERATDLLGLLGHRFGAAPIGVLFNTHWHVEHTGGNDAIAARGVETIIAHENTRLWMSTKFYVEWEDRYYQRRAPASRPNKTFFTSDKQPLELTFGGERVVYGQLTEAHTDGDVYVHLPDRNVIVAGGAVAAAHYPVLDYITGGWIGGMAEATQRLIALSDASTLIVPDAGPPQKRADLEEQLKMLTTVRERIEAIALQGRGVQDMIAEAITKEFDERYSAAGSAQFISNAYESMWWNRLRGIVA
jgi:glyoxylase-like metal-dependent hydrolase (beta-lactamase superfamily II)